MCYCRGDQLYSLFSRALNQEKYKMLIRSSVVILLLGLLGLSCGSSEELESSSGLRLLMKLYEDCQKKGLVPCIKMKAITFFDRAARSNEIIMAENFSVVRDSKTPISQKVMTEAELEESLPRGNEEARDSRLNSILFKKIADFFNSHKLVFSLPKINPEEIQEGVEEGRGKMKKMMSMMMMGFAMKMAAAVPMALGLLFLLAGKALIISKLALVMTLLIALKKLLSQKQSHEIGWQSSGGWDRRSYIPHLAAQELAYRGHLYNSISAPGKH